MKRVRIRCRRRYSGAGNDRHSHAFSGDVVTEAAIITDGEACLFRRLRRGRVPGIDPGDFLEITGTVTDRHHQPHRAIAGAQGHRLPLQPQPVRRRGAGRARRRRPGGRDTAVGKEHSPWPGRQEPTDRVTDAVHRRTGDIRLVGRAEELTRLTAADTGDALRTQARPEAALLVDLFRHFPRRRRGGEEHYSAGRGPQLQGTRQEPVDVVGAFRPWNSPLMSVGFKVPTALAAGHTIVLKAAEDAPLSTCRWRRSARSSYRPAFATPAPAPAGPGRGQGHWPSGTTP